MPKSTPQPRMSETGRSTLPPAATLARPLQASSGKAAASMRDARLRDECHCDDGPERLSPRAARHRW